MAAITAGQPYREKAAGVNGRSLAKAGLYAFIWGALLGWMAVKAGPVWAAAVGIAWLSGLFAGRWLEAARSPRSGPATRKAPRPQ
jgi:hypothetical protein